MSFYNYNGEYPARGEREEEEYATGTRKARGTYGDSMGEFIGNYSDMGYGCKPCGKGRKKYRRKVNIKRPGKTSKSAQKGKRKSVAKKNNKKSLNPMILY